MIPLFPRFKKLAISDKADIEKLARLHPPYSDYNFVSLFTWDTKEQIAISKLYQNLVVRFTDYITGEAFYSLLGTNRVDESIDKLIDRARDEEVDTTLRLIPEVVTKHIKNPKKFIITEDRDNHDYILSIDVLVDLRGKPLRGKKNFVNRFEKQYGHRSKVMPLDLTKKKVQKQILELFETWEKSRGKERKDTENELIAVKKLLSHAQDLNLSAVGLFVDHTLVGFSINEIVHSNHGVIHYEKGDIAYTGVFQYLKRESAKHLKTQGLVHLNYEQDLGIEGLRKAKLSYQPVNYLKKYTISRR